MTTAAVEHYTGEGEAPYCEMTLRADEDYTTNDGNFTVTLNRTKPLLSIKIKRKNERLSVATSFPITTSVGMHYSVSTVFLVLLFLDNSNNKECVCQVFFAKFGINTWKIIYSFIPKGIDHEVLPY